MMERREHERFSVVDLVLYDQETGRPIGKVVNISVRGLLVISSRKFEVGDVLGFSIPFTKTVEGMVKFDFQGEVRWAHPNDQHPSRFSIGIQFVENPELQTMFIHQLVDLYGAS
jgi:Tfp pilus assembly protein PilZ